MSSRFCTQCGGEQKTDSKFCPLCGTLLADEGRSRITVIAASKTATVFASNRPTPNKASGWKNHWLTGVVAWSVVGVFVLIYLNYRSHGKVGLDISSIGTGLNGTYILERNSRLSGISAQLTINGNRATTAMSDGTTGNARIERIGTTLKLLDYQSYKDGYLKPTTDDSKTEIFSILNDGQILQEDLDGHTLRFIKQ